MSTRFVIAILIAMGAFLRACSPGIWRGNAKPTQEVTEAGPALSVDAAAGRHTISPYIYGMNKADELGDLRAFMDEIDLPVRRWGGNLTTRYNWKTDISNHAFDWYFLNSRRSEATNPPDDSAANRFINQNRGVNTDSFLVMPMSGWVANNDPRACGFSISKYGAQQANAASDGRPDCGNGVRPDGSLITGNNPLDTSIAVGPEWVTEWVTYLRGRFGAANQGGVRFYNLDNEPDIWFSSHRDIVPQGMTYDQFYQRSAVYAAAIKAGDPAAQVLGPGQGSYSYYFYSPYDGQRRDWNSPDDMATHGGLEFTPWFLDQMRLYEQANGRRLLDYLDLHFYPQNGVALTTAGDASMQALRLRSTRALWDPTYVDESWIGDQSGDRKTVKLIPRMREWIDKYYPGTRLAIGEYQWGGLEHINGALAQADILGIFGRENVDLAALWEPPFPNQPGAYAFRMYRNYDGRGKKFGDVSVRAASGDQIRLSVFAAERSDDHAITIMVVNKTGVTLSSPVTLAGFNWTGVAQAFRYSAANLNAIQRLADQPIGPTGFSHNFPSNSITLFVIPTGRAVTYRYNYLPYVAQ